MKETLTYNMNLGNIYNLMEMGKNLFLSLPNLLLWIIVIKKNEIN